MKWVNNSFSWVYIGNTQKDLFQILQYLLKDTSLNDSLIKH